MVKILLLKVMDPLLLTKVNVEGDLKGITSIFNADGGPKMTIGGNSINITGGPLNMGGSKITNVGSWYRRY